jgi:hypothetical protein
MGIVSVLVIGWWFIGKQLKIRQLPGLTRDFKKFTG